VIEIVCSSAFLRVTNNAHQELLDREQKLGGKDVTFKRLVDKLSTSHRVYEDMVERKFFQRAQNASSFFLLEDAEITARNKAFVDARQQSEARWLHHYNCRCSNATNKSDISIGKKRKCED
jgi:hypothetical protein